MLTNVETISVLQFVNGFEQKLRQDFLSKEDLKNRVIEIKRIINFFDNVVTVELWEQKKIEDKSFLSEFLSIKIKNIPQNNSIVTLSVQMVIKSQSYRETELMIISKKEDIEVKANALVEWMKRVTVSSVDSKQEVVKEEVISNA